MGPLFINQNAQRRRNSSTSSKSVSSGGCDGSSSTGANVLEGEGDINNENDHHHNLRVDTTTESTTIPKKTKKSLSSKTSSGGGSKSNNGLNVNVTTTGNTMSNNASLCSSNPIKAHVAVGYAKCKSSSKAQIMPGAGSSPVVVVPPNPPPPLCGESTSTSTEDFSNNEDFPLKNHHHHYYHHLQQRPKPMKMNRSNNNVSSTANLNTNPSNNSINKGIMNPGQFLVNNSNHSQHQQQPKQNYHHRLFIQQQKQKSQSNSQIAGGTINNTTTATTTGGTAGLMTTMHPNLSNCNDNNGIGNNNVNSATGVGANSHANGNTSRDKNNTNHNNTTGNNNTNGIRKYLVLLQDCLAIKFVSPGQPHHSQQFHFAFNNNNNNNSNKSNTLNGSRSFSNPVADVYDHTYDNDEGGDGTLPNINHVSGGGYNHHHNVHNHHQMQNPMNGNNLNGPNGSQGGCCGGLESSTAEVDHSLHGLYLYKGFREANLKCYWNATLCEAIRNLDYKGYIVPSTILVFALPRFLSVLRTAWSRKMLRNPPGYRVEFVGEIEEIIAEPIPQGQFAPLSDSLCWAILELTSSGQEAFVDSILFALSSAFPSMTLPPRELVYQTLEKLIRDRKIYQTSHGYFVVTPDTFRYMNSGGDSSYYTSLSTSTLPLDALMSSYYESDKISQHSWGSTGSGNIEDEIILPRRGQIHSPLKRHNSLKVIRQRDLDLLLPTMGARSLSFRLSKTKSVFESDREDKLSSNRSSTLDSRSDAMTSASNSKDESTETNKDAQGKSKAKSRKKASFFRRWFSFRRSKPSKSQTPDPSKVQLESLTRSPKIYSSISRARQPTEMINSSNNNASTQTQTAALSTARSYEVIHDLIDNESPTNFNEEYIYPVTLRNMSKWSSLPSAGSRRSRSRRSILNDSPFYDTLTFNRANNYSGRVDTPTTGDFMILDNGRKYSTATNKSMTSSSLGYGSQRPLSLNLQSPSSLIGMNMNQSNGNAGSVRQQRLRHVSGTNPNSIRTDSPCPSTSVSAIYASIANGNTNPTGQGAPLPPNPSGSYKNLTFNDVYRRRNPSQGSQSHRSGNRYASRPKSAFELLAYQNQQNRKKSMESLSQQHQVNNSPVSVNITSVKKPVVSTTTVTQNVRSTTSTELEVLLPIGKLVTAALSSRMGTSGSKTGNEKSSSTHNGKSEGNNATKSSNISNGRISVDVETTDDGTFRMTSKPLANTTTETQVTTTVNNNGTVETHFSSDTNTGSSSLLVETCNNCSTSNISSNNTINKESLASH